MFRTDVNERTNERIIELCIIDVYCVRAAPWGYGSGNMDERQDKPVLASLVHGMRFRGGLIGAFT
jgi:hypothetical protein